MVRRNTLLRRQVAEHRRLLMIGTTHKTILYDYVLAAKSPTYFFRSLLDTSFAVIDAAVAIKLSQVETLDALRRSIISRAITFGLSAQPQLRRVDHDWL